MRVTLTESKLQVKRHLYLEDDRAVSVELLDDAERMRLNAGKR